MSKVEEENYESFPPQLFMLNKIKCRTEKRSQCDIRQKISNKNVVIEYI